MTHLEALPTIPFTVTQAAAAGLSRRGLRNAVAQRSVLRLMQGAYLRADVEPTALIRAQAAGLVMSEHMVVCDRTAAWIHGVETFDYWELDVAIPLEAYVLRGHAPPERRDCEGGSRDLQPQDWLELGGVKVTTPLRTTLDLGCKLSRRQALAAMDSLARLHEIAQTEMRGALPRYFRRRGVVQLRQLVPLVDGRSESPAESWMRLEILDHGLPAPTPQHWVMVDGVPTYRLDLAYPHARVAIEYDGQQFHSGVQARRHDEERRSWLRANGWIVIVLDLHSFSAEAIENWVSELRTGLRMAG